MTDLTMTDRAMAEVAMTDVGTTEVTRHRLVQTWVPVTDVRGRRYLEARWTESAPRGGARAHVTHAA